MRALVLTLCFAAAASAEVVRSPQGLLSVDASGQPLEAVLQQISGVVSLEMLLIDPAVRSWPVTVSVRDHATPEALKAILSAAGVNYVVMGTKLYAGDPASAVAFVPSARAADEAHNAVARAQHEAKQHENFEALMQAMAPVEHPQGPRTVTLPFPDKDGNPRTVEVGGSPDGMVALPFPGPDGKLGRRVSLDPALRVPPPAFTVVLPTGAALEDEPEPAPPPKN